MAARATCHRYRRVGHSPADRSPGPGDSRATPLSLVELGRDIDPDDVILEEGYAYPAYGIPSEETNEAIRLLRAHRRHDDGPRSTRESPLQGLVDLVRRDFFPQGSKVLYAHLGGVPAINAYSYVYREG